MERGVVCCRRRHLLLLAFFSIAFFLLVNLRPDIRGRHEDPEPAFPAADRGFGRVNSTLGFGAIVAVSRPGSRRRDSLLLAANLTGLDISVPVQPEWTDEHVKSVQAEHNSVISRGSALAWLGHLNALKWFVENTTSQSALIIEDDVDWDVHLRTHQVPLVAAAVRMVTNESSFQPPSISGDESDIWGTRQDWEILYLGHCGDFFALDQLHDVDHVRFRDSSLPSSSKLHVQTAHFLHDLGVGDHERLVHPSVFPLCSFAYAVTRASAERILREFSHEEDGKGTPAFDVRLLEACRDMGWKCFTANPELFHHVSEHSSEIATANNDTPPPQKDEKASTQPSAGTPNIGCSARRAVDVARKDPGTIDVILSVANRPSLCIVDNADDLDNNRR